MPIQTTYAATLPAAVEGMIANMEDFNTITRLCETAAGIGFGKVAVRGTADNQCKVAAASTLPLGITVLDNTRLPENPDKYALGDNVDIMTKGVIWVLAGEDVVPGDPVYFIPATGVLVKASAGNILIPDAVWDTTALNGALAKIRLA